MTRHLVVAIALAGRLRTVACMTKTDATTDPVEAYVRALRAAGEIEAPFGAVIFTILTALVRPCELVHPTTTAAGNSLFVAAGLESCGPFLDRELPLPSVTTQLLAPGGPGPITACLGLKAVALPRLDHDLALAMLDHDDLSIFGPPEQAWGRAVHALTTAAGDRQQRTAVLAYAGIGPLGVRGGTRAETVDEAALTSVARLVDLLAAEAGFSTSGAADRGAA